MNTQYKKGVLELCVLALVLIELKNAKSLRLCRRLFMCLLLSYEIHGQHRIGSIVELAVGVLRNKGELVALELVLKVIALVKLVAILYEIERANTMTSASSRAAILFTFLIFPPYIFILFCVD